MSSRATTIDLPIEPTVNRALLISSYTDGVLPNEMAHNFIRNSLLLKFTSDKLEELEEKIESSARLAPCCGPNARLITDMEELDEEVQQLKDLTHQESSEIPDQIIEKNGDLVLRLIYIPTALYALRPDSSNTPGKQRQRARYDAKQRRIGLESFLIDLFDSEDDDITVNVVAVTLDLDDGSIKQASCSKEGSKCDFPEDGKEALISWSPDMIYVEGGNTFWLQHCIEKGDWNEDLISACSGSSGAFYCGKSAGAIIAGNTVETATWKEMDDPRVVPGKEEYGDWKGVSGLGLTGGLNIFPHMAEKWSEVVSEQDLKNVVHLSDEEVCCVDGIENEATMLSPVEDNSVTS